MAALAVRLSALALAGALPLILSTSVEEVFFLPWRAGLWAWLAIALAWSGGRWLTGRGAPPVFTWSSLPWALFAVWVFAGVLWSRNPQDSLRHALELAGAVLAYWLGRAAANDWPRLRAAAIGAAALCSIYGLLQFLGYDPLPWSTKFGARAFGTLANPNYYAGYLMLAIPLALAPLAARVRPGIPAVAAALLLGIGFLISQVRGAWLAGAGAAAWTAWVVVRGGALPRRDLRRLGAAAAAAAVLFGIAFALSQDFRGRVASTLSVGGYDATGRRFLWRVAARIWREEPVIGFGTGSFKFEFPRHQHIGLTMGLPQFRPYNYSEHAHNDLLQIGAELGLIGVLLFLWGTAAWWRGWNRRRRALAAEGRRREWWEQVAMGAGLAGMGGYSMVNLPFQVIPSAVLWWLVMGVSAGRGADAGTPRPLPATAARGLGALAVALGLGGAALAAADFPGNIYHKHLRHMGEIGNWRVAVAYGHRAQRLLPWDYRVARWLTRVAIEHGDEPLAEEMIRLRLTKLHPLLADAIADRAMLSKHFGRTKEAQERFEALVRDHPNFVSAWGELGTMYYQQGDLARASDAFGKAAFYQDTNPTWPHNQASILGQTKRYAEALSADEESVRRDPTFVEGWVGMALSLQALGRKAEARAAAEKAYQLAPTDPRAATLIRQISRSDSLR